MAHWAEIDENNIVLRVITGNNDDPDEGLAWIEENLGGRWVKTSYNANIRGKFAGIGDKYDEKKDVFVLMQEQPEMTIGIDGNGA